MKVIESEGKLLTCVLPKGKAASILKVLAEKNVSRVNFAFARGFDIHDVDKKNGIPAEEEKEILLVIAKDLSEGEELFDLIFSVGQLNHLGGGFLYMTAVPMASAYFLPQDLENPLGQGEVNSQSQLENTQAGREMGA